MVDSRKTTYRGTASLKTKYRKKVSESLLGAYVAHSLPFYTPEEYKVWTTFNFKMLGEYFRCLFKN